MAHQMIAPTGSTMKRSFRAMATSMVFVAGLSVSPNVAEAKKPRPAAAAACKTCDNGRLEKQGYTLMALTVNTPDDFYFSIPGKDIDYKFTLIGHDQRGIKLQPSGIAKAVDTTSGEAGMIEVPGDPVFLPFNGGTRMQVSDELRLVVQPEIKGGQLQLTIAYKITPAAK